VFFKPASQKIFFSYPERSRTRRTASMPPVFVRDARGAHGDGDEETHRVDDAEGPAPRDLLVGVVSPGRPRDRRRAADAASVDEPSGSLGFASLLHPHELDKTRTDRHPPAVLGPAEVIAVNGVHCG
jgi:hypothetical protein